MRSAFFRETMVVLLLLQMHFSFTPHAELEATKRNRACINLGNGHRLCCQATGRGLKTRLVNTPQCGHWFLYGACGHDTDPTQELLPKAVYLSHSLMVRMPDCRTLNMAVVGLQSRSPTYSRGFAWFTYYPYLALHCHIQTTHPLAIIIKNMKHSDTILAIIYGMQRITFHVYS